MFLTTDDGRRPTPLPRKNCNHLAPKWVTFDAVCDDGRRPTALQRRATGDGRRTTDDGRRTTDDGRRTTARGTPATDDGRRLRPTTTTTATTTTSTNRSHSRSTDATTTERTTSIVSGVRWSILVAAKPRPHSGRENGHTQRRRTVPSSLGVSVFWSGFRAPKRDHIYLISNIFFKKCLAKFLWAKRLAPSCCMQRPPVHGHRVGGGWASSARPSLATSSKPAPTSGPSRRR